MPETTYRKSGIGLPPLTFSGRLYRLPLNPWTPRMQAGLNGTGLRAISPGLEYYRHNEVAIS
jgi:hypothetical protein